MLKRLTLQNFQKHRKQILRFDRYLTIIVGPNDAGKSAILRALRWVCLNRPNSKSLIRRGSTSTTVTAVVDRRKIIRRGGKQNTYELDESIFKSFRSEVPEDISKLLRLDEINFQRQHESHFWFGKSPGEVAKLLNQLVDLESIDRVQAAISKRLRDAKSEFDIVHKNIESSRADLARLRWVSRLWSQIDQLTGMAELYRTQCTRLARIRSLAADGSRQLTRERKALAGLSVAQNGHIAADTLAGRLDRITRLQAVCGAIRRAGGRFCGKLPGIDPLARRRERFNRLSTMLDAADLLVLDEATAVGELKQINDDLRKELDGRCPTCKQSLPDDFHL